MPCSASYQMPYEASHEVTSAKSSRNGIRIYLSRTTMFGSSFGKAPIVPTPNSQIGQSSAGHNPNNDYEVPEVSTDGISTVNFSPVSDHFVATSWDCTVRVWEYATQKGLFGGPSQSSIHCTPKAMQSHNEPVLCSTFNRDGRGVFFGGTDGQVRPAAANGRYSMSCLTGQAMGLGIESGAASGPTRTRRQGVCVHQ